LKLPFAVVPLRSDPNSTTSLKRAVIGTEWGAVMSYQCFVHVLTHMHIDNIKNAVFLQHGTMFWIDKVFQCALHTVGQHCWAVQCFRLTTIRLRRLKALAELKSQRWYFC